MDFNEWFEKESKKDGTLRFTWVCELLEKAWDAGYEEGSCDSFKKEKCDKKTIGQQNELFL